ncbi:MAG: 3-ketoacyl-ACP reductase [Ruminococcaceae bacterium]|nr:3-ketoacyl-ACP reductase [Oscillospiraceae bacterium]
MKKIALVTGVAGGIGFATAKKLLENGVSVVGMDVLPQMPQELEGDFTYFKGDLSDKKSREAYLKTAMEKYGRVDILVNVAGVAPKVRADILEMTEESYDFVMNINTKGTLFLTQAVANVMKENKSGSIVNISSMSGYTSSVSRGEYCISKAGVTMITTLFADRLAEYGIMVNEIRPGIIATGMTDKVKAKYDALIDGGLLPIKRWGKPEDIANAVWTLCNGSLPYVTGQSIDVDGGFHIRRL